MILSAQSIRELKLIQPFEEKGHVSGISFGLGPASYDVRVEFDHDGTQQIVRLLPGAFLLVSTIEKIEVPDNLLVMVHDKSTWARRGLAVQNTVIDPGFRGHITLEISHHGHSDIELRRGDPIAQLVFHVLDKPTERPYWGKYQNQQRGPVRAK